MIKLGQANHNYLSKINLNDSIDNFYEDDVEEYPIDDNRESIGEATEKTRKRMEEDIKYEHGRN